MDILLDTIKDALKDVHIETGRQDEFDKVCEMIRDQVSRKIITQEIDYYTETE